MICLPAETSVQAGHRINIEHSMKLKIAILGTRGIPNQYGGFEQFAQYLSKGLAEKGHQVYVYNPHDHSWQNKLWNKVNIIHKYDPEFLTGKLGQFIYDFNCILDSRKRKFDLILQLGYTSNSVWWWLLPKKSTTIVTNMDGLEWKNVRYNPLVRKFLKFAESLAVHHSDYHIADSVGIQNYLKKQYHIEAKYISYGATPFAGSDEPVPIKSGSVLKQYRLQPYKYDMLIARLVPDNNIEMILEAAANTSIQRDFLVIGNYETKYGNFLKKKFVDKNIKWVGTIFDQNILNNLRFYSNLYFHGHSTGGTNPSLLEAMACSALICAHNNQFNRAVLGNDAYYFTDKDDITKVYSTINKNENEQTKIQSNLKKIRTLYSKEKIINAYADFFNKIISY